MAFISGSITSANPAADLYALMDTALNTAGYTLIDTVVISTRTHKIWRSNAAGNDANLNWFLDVAYTTTGAGSIWIAPFEDYNAATDIAYRGVVFDTSATVETTYYSRFGATGSALETNWMGATSTINSLDLSSAAFSYWISITQNRVIGLTSISAEKVVYCGLWEPNAAFLANATTASFPLVVGTVGSNAASSTGGITGYAGVTRVPRTTTLSRWNRAALFWSGHYFVNHPEGGYGALGAADANPFFGAVPPRGKYIYLVLNNSTGFFAADSSLYGSNANATANVGRMKDVLSFLAAPTVTRGDTVTIDGNTWVLCSKFAAAYATTAFRAL